ncbi:CS domain and HSP20-like chaperone domain-containing protein [Strongyloides ratti]|uniref:NudC domain-containing protein 1 n=1 Tax=Strongyloides ratti TaxID=34506 RepID=A0A090MV72_STRRB|nr:CS domain and HSP20-like chaperone domain-containing protein [Strongyloides ratti]CEF62683.1 CS domain and HSP20-like chaperone domain-containing protein [Strongyloides ratti]
MTSNKKAVLVELNPDPTLIDREFESYRLAFSNYKISYTSLPNSILNCQRNSQLYSFLHLRLYADQNNIFLDTFAPCIKIYTVLTDGSIYSLEYDEDTSKFINCRRVFEHFLKEDNEGWEIPKDDNEDYYRKHQELDNYPFSLFVVSEEYVVASNGKTDIFVFKKDECKWDVVYHEALSRNLIIVDSRMDGSNNLHLLTKTIIEKSECPYTFEGMSAHLCSLKWIKLTMEDESWIKSGEKVIYAPGNVELCTFDYDFESVIIQSTMEPFIKYVENKYTEQMEYLDGKEIYTWKQDKSKIFMEFSLPVSLNNDDVVVNFTKNSINVLVKGENIFNETLENDIVQSSVTHRVSDTTVYIEFNKVVEEDWSELIEKSKSDNDTTTPLVNVTEDLNSFNLDNNAIFTKREECDDERLENTFIYWVDYESEEIKYQSSLITDMPLFSQKFSPSTPTSICLREDVDGIIWSFPGKKTGKSIFHKSTFNALGYIQASKSRRKYTISSPLCSYVAIVEALKNIHVYWRSEQLSGEGLVNRKSGQRISKIAKQNVICLTKESYNEYDSKTVVTDDIFGCICLEKFIIIALKNELAVVVL